MTSASHPLTDHVGRRIRAVRRAAGLTAAALARRLDWPADTLINYEYGRRPLTLDRLAAIAAALNVTPVALLLPDEADVELVDGLVRDPELAHDVRFFLTTLQAELAAQDDLQGNGT